MKEKYMYPFSILVSVILRWLGVWPWLCDLYLLNVVMLDIYLHHHTEEGEEEPDGGADGGTLKDGEEQQHPVRSRRLSLHFSRWSGGVMHLSFWPDDVMVRSGVSGSYWSSEQEMSAEEEEQMTSSEFDVLEKAMELPGRDVSPPSPPARLVLPLPLFPKHRVARARARAAQMERSRAREYAGKN